MKKKNRLIPEAIFLLIDSYLTPKKRSDKRDSQENQVQLPKSNYGQGRPDSQNYEVPYGPNNSRRNEREKDQHKETNEDHCQKSQNHYFTFLSVGNALNGVPDFEALGGGMPVRAGLTLGVTTRPVNILAAPHEHLTSRGLEVEIHHNKNFLSLRGVPS